MTDLAYLFAATLSLFAPTFYAYYLGREVNIPFYLIRGPHQ